MDRNLGALDDRYHEKAEIKSKYYQFGRKDPFNSDIYCWTYDPDTFAATKSATKDGMNTNMIKAHIDGASPGGYGTQGHNVPFSVGHPSIFICLSSVEVYYSWSSITDLFGGTTLEDNKTTKYWNDPRPFIRFENEEISMSYENKSFFDPCPLGWRLPVSGWVSGFIGDDSGSATGSNRMNFQQNVDSDFRNRGSGRTYVPLGYLSQKGNINAQTAFFPSCGTKSYSIGMNNIGSHGFYWCCAPSSTNSGRDLFWPPFTTGRSDPRASGFQVRCVKE